MRPLKLSKAFRVIIALIVFLIAGRATSLTGQTHLVTGEINKYAKVTSVGTEFVIVDDVSGFEINDTVMIMQMSGVRISAGPTLEGNYQSTIGSPGKYEILIVSDVNSGLKRVSFTKSLLYTYDAEGKVQLIRMKSYNSAVVNSELTCQAWDSTNSKGGVLAFMVKGLLTLNADINVSGKGFRGGITAQGNGNCQVSDDTMRLESYSISSRAAGYKGEGLGLRTASNLSLYPAYMKGKGANMTGGGGGNGHFSGGGGGSNYGAGSVGDQEMAPDVCGGLYPGGRGGFTISFYPALNTGVFMGGGGGASVWLTVPSTSPGGNGGGIVIIIANNIAGNGKVISATGAGANDNTAANSGAGGGGGGGSVIVSSRYFLSNPVLTADGGKGGNNISQNGAGGGGGGGLIWTAGAFLGTATVNGGQGGTHSVGDPKRDGYPGAIWTNLKLALNGFLFNAVYSSISLSQIDSICEGTRPPVLKGSLVSGGSGNYSYQWQRSYNNLSWSNVSGTDIDYTPTDVETDTVWFRRIVDDGAGITDISEPVQIIVHSPITGNLIGSEMTICYNTQPPELHSSNSGPSGGTGLYFYTWQQSPDNNTWSNAIGGNTSSNYGPPALNSTTYYHRVVNSGACTDISSPVTVTVWPAITGNNIQADQTICEGSTFNNLIGGTPGGGPSPTYTYQWLSSPDNINWASVEGNSTSINYDPQNDSPSTTYYRRIVYSGICQSTSSSVQLTCHPAIINNIIASPQTICEGSSPATLDGSVPLNGAGAGTYLFQWMSSSNGTNYENISGATYEDFTGTALTKNMWYRRIVNSLACSSLSNEVMITVEPAITGFQIGMDAQGHDTICTGDTPTMLLGTPAGGLGTYTYLWASSIDNTNFTNLPATTQTYQPGALTTTTWLRRTVNSGTCSESSIFKVTVLPLITNNAISANQAVCNTNIPAPLTGSSPSGGDGTYRYLWEMKENSSSDWIPATGANNNRGYQPPMLSAATQFRRIVFSGENDCCSSISAVVTVTINFPPGVAGTIVGNNTVCQGQNSITYLVPSIEGATSYIWALPSGAIGTSTTNSITVNYGLAAASGDITVRGSNSCGFGDPSTLTVTVINKPPIPTISITGNILHSNAASGNQWYSESGLISGATSQDYTVTTTGDYYVIVTLSGCSSDPSNSIHAVPTDIDIPNPDQSLKIYPNPAQTTLLIEGLSEDVIVTVYDLQGNLVLEKQLSEDSLNIHNLAPGVYTIRLESKGETITRRFVKN